VIFSERLKTAGTFADTQGKMRGRESFRPIKAVLENEFPLIV
jgi:hypothetical protein